MSRFSYALLVTAATSTLVGTALLDASARQPALWLFIVLGTAGAVRAWQAWRAERRA